MTDTTTTSRPPPRSPSVSARSYADAARRVQAGGGGCCGERLLRRRRRSAFGSALYAGADTDALPEEAVRASLGCGNPTALIDLRAGETVLDLGSGGGIDVLLSARRVGPTGFAFGLDMTDEMLALAQANKATAGLTNVAFLKGQMEAIPLPTDSVDVVISNCVINLAADKALVLQRGLPRPQARRPLRRLRCRRRWRAAGRAPPRHGSLGRLPGRRAGDRHLSARCSAEAGFGEIDVEITRRYTVAESGIDTDPPAGRLGSGRRPPGQRLRPRHQAPRHRPPPPHRFVAAESGSACCGPDCCS